MEWRGQSFAGHNYRKDQATNDTNLSPLGSHLLYGIYTNEYRLQPDI